MWRSLGIHGPWKNILLRANDITLIHDLHQARFYSCDGHRCYDVSPLLLESVRVCRQGWSDSTNINPNLVFQISPLVQKSGSNNKSLYVMNHAVQCTGLRILLKLILKFKILYIQFYFEALLLKIVVCVSKRDWNLHSAAVQRGSSGLGGKQH